MDQSMDQGSYIVDDLSYSGQLLLGTWTVCSRTMGRATPPWLPTAPYCSPKTSLWPRKSNYYGDFFSIDHNTICSNVRFIATTEQRHPSVASSASAARISPYEEPVEHGGFLSKSFKDLSVARAATSLATSATGACSP